MPVNSYKGYYGIMKGIVTRTDDPQLAEHNNRKRIQVCIPSYHGEPDESKYGSGSELGEYPWAQVCSSSFNGSSGSNSDNTSTPTTGFSFIGSLIGLISGNKQNNSIVSTTSADDYVYPCVGDRVWLMFEGGDIRCPVCVGTLAAKINVDNSFSMLGNGSLYVGDGTSLGTLCINMISSLFGLGYGSIINSDSVTSSSSNLKLTASAIVSDFQVMYREHWSYVWGSAKKGCVDCSGAFTYAYKLHGLSIYNGSNRIARVNTVRLIPYDEAVRTGQIVPGMAAFKTHNPGESGYDLPNEYKSGGKYYNGDLKDYYHIGLVDSDTNYVLNAANPDNGFMRGKITNNWTYVAKLKEVDYGDSISINSSTENIKYSKFGILGWFDNSAKELLTLIKGASATEFTNILNSNSAENFLNDLEKSSWSNYKVQTGSNIYKALTSILQTQTGISYQDNKALTEINNLISDATTAGLSNKGAIMLYVFTVYRNYKEFANYAANVGGSNSTLDSFYENLMNKFASYSDTVKSVINKAYSYISTLDKSGVFTALDNVSDPGTPSGNTPSIGSTISASGDGVSSATAYNNWYIGLKATTLGSTHRNPSKAHIWNAHKVYNALRSQGYNLPSICGILGNMQTESGISPGAIQNKYKSQLPNNATILSNLTNNVMLGFYDHSNPNHNTRGYAVGLIQWDGYTVDANPNGEVIASYAIRNNKMWYDGDLQMSRLAFEYEHDKSGGNVPVETTGKTYKFWYPENYGSITWRQYKTINKSAKECADIFRACRERSSGDPTGNANRRDNAEYWYDYFSSSPVDPTSGSAIASSAVSSSVTNTAVQNNVSVSSGPNTDAIKPKNFKQFDSQWKNKQFGPGSASDRTYGAAACSVTSMADIVYTFADTSVTPVTIGDLAVSWGYRTATSNGLTDAAGFFKRCAEKYGFKMTSSYKGDGSTCYDKIRNALDTGQNITLLILGVKGIYSKNGHFVVAWKTNGDKTCICDPGINSSTENGKKRENASSSDLKSSVNSLYIFKKN